MPSILFLTQILPYPLDSGSKVRAYHVLRWLAERADVHLVSFTRDGDPPEAVDHLASVCAGVHTVKMWRSRLRDLGFLVRSLVFGSSFIIERDSVDGMYHVINDLVRLHGFDAVHADQLWMVRYARGLPIRFRVLDKHNAVYLIFDRLAVHERSAVRRLVWRREAHELARYESEQLAHFDRVLFVTENDRLAMQAVMSNVQSQQLLRRSSVIPVCVDASGRAPIAQRPDARRITILGTMYWPPNVEGVLWFGENVLVRVLEAVPDAVLTVIGKSPPDEVRCLEGRFGDAVEVTGYAPDLTSYLKETAVFAVPLLTGGGMRVKILDAWAWGLPVLSTTIGAEGMDIRGGEDIMIADDPTAFAEETIRLLLDPVWRAAVGRRGRAAVENRYDVRNVYHALSEVYAPVLG